MINCQIFKLSNYKLEYHNLIFKLNFVFKFLFLFTLYSLLFTLPVLAVDPHLELSPSSGSIGTSGTNIDVKIDTGGLAAKSAKAVIKYDSALLSVLSITAGTFFDEVSHNIYNSSGEVVINANLSLGGSLETKTGVGTLATLNVQALQSTGTANITFDCTTGSSTDSGINDATPTDIIVCTANINGSYSLGGGSGGTSSPGPSSVPTPSALPNAGNIGPTVSILAIGLALILLSLPLFLFV